MAEEGRIDFSDQGIGLQSGNGILGVNMKASCHKKRKYKRFLEIPKFFGIAENENNWDPC